MRAALLLCDYASVAEGKLYISGAGWDATGPGPTSHFVAVLVRVPWDLANTKIQMVLKLTDADGQDATIDNGLGPQPVQLVGNIEVGRAPGLTRGQELNVPLAVPIGPLLLNPGRYRWELWLNDDHQVEWELPFGVRGVVADASPSSA